jgi:hypothetical protein
VGGGSTSVVTQLRRTYTVWNRKVYSGRREADLVMSSVMRGHPRDTLTPPVFSQRELSSPLSPSPSAQGVLARVQQIHDRAVVAERSAATEVGDGGEDVFHCRTLGSRGL